MVLQRNPLSVMYRLLHVGVFLRQSVGRGRGGVVEGGGAEGARSTGRGRRQGRRARADRGAWPTTGRGSGTWGLISVYLGARHLKHLDLHSGKFRVTSQGKESSSCSSLFIN